MLSMQSVAQAKFQKQQRLIIDYRAKREPHWPSKFEFDAVTAIAAEHRRKEITVNTVRVQCV